MLAILAFESGAGGHLTVRLGEELGLAQEAEACFAAQEEERRVLSSHPHHGYQRDDPGQVS